MKKDFTVPLYDCRVRVIIESDIGVVKKLLPAHLKGACDDITDFLGLCCWDTKLGGNLAIILKNSASGCSMNVVAHEVFHLTHRIMEWMSCNFDAAHHEQGCILHGFLMEKITKIIETHKQGSV